MPPAYHAELSAITFLVAQRVEAVGGHHRAVGAVVVAAPAEVLELEAQVAARGGQRLQHFAARGDHFLADAVSGNGGDGVEDGPVGEQLGVDAFIGCDM